MGGQCLVAARVTVEGLGDAWICVRTWGSFFNPRISLYSLEMALKTRLQYWKLDEQTIKKI